MTEGVEYKEIEQADSQMIAEQLARVTLNMIHSLYGADRVRFRRMSRLILAAIPPALKAEIKSDEAFTRSGLWRAHCKARGKVPG
jgi:hypothetical protein